MPKVIDFPEDESIEAQAARWLAALDAGQPSKKVLAAFNMWVNADKRHRHEFKSVVSFWADLNILTQVSPPRPAGCARKAAKNSRRPVFASALLVLLVVLSFVYPQLGNEPKIQTYSTSVGEQKTIHLPDRSVVFLNTDSRITVNYSEKRRAVRLERGEALFEVAHQKLKPFEVQAGVRIVRAIGTALSVHLRPNDVEVLVAEGAVEIDQPEPLSKPKLGNITPKSSAGVVEKITVPAGNQALFGNRVSDEVLVAEMQYIEDEVAWRTGVLTFEGESLERVVNEVGRYTTKKFVVPDKEVREMIVGGVFRVGDTESLFEALQLGFGIQATEGADNVVYLSRVGVGSN